jgi:hypothetical protein
MEESKLKLSDQQLDELMDVFFEAMETNHKGEIGLDQFKAFLSEYPEVAENLSIRYQKLCTFSSSQPIPGCGPE